MFEQNEPKKVRKADGTIMFIWEGKIHNMSGPALVTVEGKNEYYIHGIQYDEKTFLKRIKEKEGLPWHKSAGMKGKTRF